MIVLGIDPGTATTGYGVVQTGERGSVRWKAHGTVRTSPELPPEQRLAQIYAELSELLRVHQPDVAAMEELFFKNNITSGISVGQARGVAMLACAHANVAVAHYKPAQVKQGVVGVGKATKEQMQAMVKTLLGLPEIPKPDDAADGLAVAICHLLAAPFMERRARASF